MGCVALTAVQATAIPHSRAERALLCRSLCTLYCHRRRTASVDPTDTNVKSIGGSLGCGSSDSVDVSITLLVESACGKRTRESHQAPSPRRRQGESATALHSPTSSGPPARG